MFKLSEKRLKDISVYGGGLLLGAALSIVIPEGIEAVYDATDKGSEHNSTWLALALLLGFLAMYVFFIGDLTEYSPLIECALGISLMKCKRILTPMSNPTNHLRRTTKTR